MQEQAHSKKDDLISTITHIPGHQPYNRPPPKTLVMLKLALWTGSNLSNAHALAVTSEPVHSSRQTAVILHRQLWTSGMGTQMVGQPSFTGHVRFPKLCSGQGHLCPCKLQTDGDLLQAATVRFSPSWLAKCLCHNILHENNFAFFENFQQKYTYDKQKDTYMMNGAQCDMYYFERGKSIRRKNS